MAGMSKPMNSLVNSKSALKFRAAAFAVLLSVAASRAQSPAAQPLVIDASAPASAPGPANYQYDPADAKSPTGHTLGLNAEYLTLDGKPWLPVMGEIHYSRVPEAEWETEILKMKSAGVQVISTYLIWIHHEEVEGQWDWSGNKDLRKFVQLCAKHGMYVVPRIGPWSHAEVRNGGFPDWLLAKTSQTRSNDPAYLQAVDLYYQQIAAQLQGLMWSEGGPVIAIQLENEYRGRPPNGGAPHILKLKELARNAGLRVPFYTVTGWDGASIPAGAVLPVYGGYPDAPWDASIQPLPPSEVYAFRFGSRVTGDMGAVGAPPTPAIGARAPTGNAANFTRDTPFMTAEMGGGMQVTYHRRPIVSADDIAAMMPVMLGSGVNLYGSYMFHGGENPDGKLTTLQESLATKYANDLPQKTYDFEAPIGEFGDERESLFKLKTWNYFLNDFGPTLAPMQPHAPNVLPAGARDLSVPRVAARTLGSSGFLFVNNHVRSYPMPARDNFQVTIKLPDNKSVTLPSKPIALPADAYFVWPFNMDLSGLHLRFATAQPLAILGTKAAPVYAFVAQPNIPAEFVVDDTPGLKLDSSIHPLLRDGALWLRAEPAAAWLPQHTIRFTLASEHRVTLWVLNQQDAERGWKITTANSTQLLITQQQAFVDKNTATIVDLGNPTFVAWLLPAMHTALVPADPRVKLTKGAGYQVTFPNLGPGIITLTPTQTKPADAPAPLPADFKPSTRPRVVAAAPTDADWSRAATWSIPLPKSAFTDTPTTSPTEQYFLRVIYNGDVARLSIPIDGKDHLLDDNFADSRPWLVGLTRFAPQFAQASNESGAKLTLSIYPLRPNPPIFFEPGHEPNPDTPPAALIDAALLTQYTLKLKLVLAPTRKP
jgi:beta-galactosidase